jgi:hypothetical protein
VLGRVGSGLLPQEGGWLGHQIPRDEERLPAAEAGAPSPTRLSTRLGLAGLGTPLPAMTGVATIGGI